MSIKKASECMSQRVGWNIRRFDLKIAFSADCVILGSVVKNLEQSKESLNKKTLEIINESQVRTHREKEVEKFIEPFDVYSF